MCACLNLAWSLVSCFHSSWGEQLKPLSTTNLHVSNRICLWNELFIIQGFVFVETTWRCPSQRGTCTQIWPVGVFCGNWCTQLCSCIYAVGQYSHAFQISLGRVCRSDACCELSVSERIFEVHSFCVKVPFLCACDKSPTAFVCCADSDPPKLPETEDHHPPALILVSTVSWVWRLWFPSSILFPDSPYMTEVQV